MARMLLTQKTSPHQSHLLASLTQLQSTAPEHISGEQSNMKRREERQTLTTAPLRCTTACEGGGRGDWREGLGSVVREGVG